MVALKGTAVIGSALSAGAERRGTVSVTGFVLARTPPWSKKPFTIRNMPYTNVEPSPLQLAVRAVFGTLASRARGVKMEPGQKIDDVILEGVLPPAAEYIQKKAKLIRDVINELATKLDLPKERAVRIALKRAQYRPTIHKLSDLLSVARQMEIADIIEKYVGKPSESTLRSVSIRGAKYIVDISTKTVVQKPAEETKT
jgi:hypothetical protein